MLVVDINYKKPLPVVEEHLEAHRNYLQECYDQNLLLASGPKSPRVGGFILANLGREAMQKLIEKDPFYLNDIAEYRITEFDPVKTSKEFKKLLSRENSPSF